MDEQFDEHGSLIFIGSSPAQPTVVELGQDRRNLEAVTDRGETPLARAAARGHGAVVRTQGQRILRYGCDGNGHGES